MVLEGLLCGVSIAKGRIELQFGGCMLCSVRIASLEEIIGGWKHAEPGAVKSVTQAIPGFRFAHPQDGSDDDDDGNKIED